MTPDNAKVNNGVLEVAHSIFRRWRPLFRSDELFTEILHVLGKFGEPFVQLLMVCFVCALFEAGGLTSCVIEHRSAN